MGLLNCFRDSLSKRTVSGAVLTTDSASTAPTAFIADHACSVPRCVHPDFLNAVFQLCTEHDVKLLVPTIDTELPIYSAAARRLMEIGVSAAISEPSTVQICCDKIATHEWLATNGFPTVRQTSLDLALRHPSQWPLPLIVKPSNGSASIGVRRVETRKELEAMDATKNWIVQDIADGREFTINVYVNRAGECICAVPHWRMEVRAGEVSKALTIKDHRLMDLARSVAEALPGAFGPLNIQCFMNDSGAIRIIEINARFGGGYPLAHRAGARFTDWLLDELEGKCPTSFDAWTDDLAMLRYDEAVFVPGGKIRT